MDRSRDFSAMWIGWIVALSVGMSLCGCAMAQPAVAQDSTMNASRFLRGVRSRMRIPIVEKGPALQGDLSSPVWRRAAKLDTFFALESSAGKAVRIQAPADGALEGAAGDKDTHAPMAAYAVSDRENLYVAFVCFEPHMDKVIAEARDRDSDKVWTDDNVELLLDPANGGGLLYQWVVSPSGAFADASHTATRHVSWADFWGRANVWNSNATVKTSVQKDRWVVELRVPLSDFGTVAFPGEMWGINFARRRKGTKSPNTSWSPYSGVPHTGGDRDALALILRGYSGQNIS